MRNPHDLWLRLRALFLRKRAEADLDDELALHVEMETRKHIAAGMNPEAARREAALRFGSGAAAKESCRDERGIKPLENLLRDTRYAFRGFRRTPLFSLTVVVTIGLGLGVNTAVFTIFNAAALRPFHVSDPYSLYGLHWVDRESRNRGFSLSQFRDLSGDQSAFSELYACNFGLQFRLNGRIAIAELVSGNYFRMLGVGPMLGRTLSPDDAAAPGGRAVAVLSYRGWHTIFGADPDIVGRKILVRGYPFEVVGVAQEGFAGLNESPQDLWAPLTMMSQVSDATDLFSQPGPESLTLVGRLGPGVTEERARAALAAWARRFDANRPENDRSTGAVLRSRATAVHVSPEDLLVLAPILAAFVLILLIACANVANMMLARAMARQREIGIRLSLGAARRRLIRQLLTESVLLALPGAAAGYLISRLTLNTAMRLVFATLPDEFLDLIRMPPLDPDLRVFAFMMGAAIASGIVFGLAPALQATRASVVRVSRGDFGNELRPQRLRNILVAFQVTICVMLLICSGVLLRGANRVHSLDTGFRTRDVLLIERREKFRSQIALRIETERLVASFAAAQSVPLTTGLPSAHMLGPKEAVADASYDYVSPEYFGVLGIPLIAGRTFRSDEAATGAPVAVVSETLARQLWPAQAAVGQTLRLLPDQRSHIAAARPFRSSAVQVIGVVRDINTGLVEDRFSRSLAYFPTSVRTAGNSLVLRVRGDPEAARQAIDRALNVTAPGGIDTINRMTQLVAGRVYPFRVAYWVSAMLGGLALLLTISGIYGVISYLVAQRIREFGLRMALGAAPGAVVALVLRQSLGIAVSGIVCGSFLAFGCARLLASRLVVIESFDRPAFAGGVAIAFVSCLAAAFAPSWRASRIDPMSTLRHD